MLWSNLQNLERIWDPWEELERMRSSLFRPAGPSHASNGEFPSVNVWSASDGVVITTELAGIEPSALDISVSGSTVTLKGARQPEELKEGESYHRRERWQGQFSKTIDLPFNVQVDKVKAKFSKGILYVELPRAEAEKPRKIEIK